MAPGRTGPTQELRGGGTNGKPTMTPESESETGIDVLRGGNQSQIGGAGTGIVATITPRSASETTGGAENVAPATDGSAARPAAQPDPKAPPATENSTTGTAATPLTTASDNAP